MRKLWPISLWIVATALPAAAQELLPSSFGRWAAASPVVNASPDHLEGLIGPNAALLREYGIAGAEQRTYTRGDASSIVTMYRMRDPSAAYGAYTLLFTAGMTPADLARYSGVARDRALIVAGSSVLEINGLKGASPGDLKALAAQLNPRADRAPYPSLAQYLPARGRVPGSERYMLGPLAAQRFLPLGNGDWIGFAAGAEAELARYRTGGQEAMLLVVTYPTPQAASRKLEELGRWFQLNPQRDDSPAPIFARRQGSLLSLVAYTKSPAFANALLDQIHHKTQVTWNEPSHRLTDPGFAAILIGTFVGTGIILLFALVAGIAFGGIRIFVKYFFPGKVFDRAAHVEILQLGLSSKPIEAKDFY